METIFRQPFTTLELEIAILLAEEYGGYWVIAPQVSEIDMDFYDLHCEDGTRYCSFERIGNDKCWVPIAGNHNLGHRFNHVFYDRSAE